MSSNYSEALEAEGLTHPDNAVPLADVWPGINDDDPRKSEGLTHHAVWARTQKTRAGRLGRRYHLVLAEPTDLDPRSPTLCGEDVVDYDTGPSRWGACAQCVEALKPCALEELATRAPVETEPEEGDAEPIDATDEATGTGEGEALPPVEDAERLADGLEDEEDDGTDEEEDEWVPKGNGQVSLSGDAVRPPAVKYHVKRTTRVKLETEHLACSLTEQAVQEVRDASTWADRMSTLNERVKPKPDVRQLYEHEAREELAQMLARLVKEQEMPLRRSLAKTSAEGEVPELLIEGDSQMACPQCTTEGDVWGTVVVGCANPDCAPNHPHRCTLNETRLCPACDGLGRVTCVACNGRGKDKEGEPCASCEPFPALTRDEVADITREALEAVHGAPLDPGAECSRGAPLHAGACDCASHRAFSRLVTVQA